MTERWVTLQPSFIKMARRTVLYLGILPLVMLGAYYMSYHSSSITAERYGLIYLPALPVALFGGLLVVLARRPPVRIIGGILAVGVLLAATVITILYTIGYIPQECHIGESPMGWYVHCHDSGYFSQ